MEVLIVLLEKNILIVPSFLKLEKTKFQKYIAFMQIYNNNGQSKFLDYAFFSI